MQSYPVANIDLVALQYNLSRVKQLAPNSQVMSVIKANAYGHGPVQAATALSDSDAFAVARLSEGLQLRQAGIQQPIVLLEGVKSQQELKLAAENSLSLVFHNQLQIELVSEADLEIPLAFCWLMVETGMHRLGIKIEVFEQSLMRLNDSPAISGQLGLMSHFANADSINDSRNQQQLDKLQQCAADKNIPLSMANSAAILSFADSHCDWVRPGLMLYGVSPFENQSASDLDLKPVMQLKSVLIAIQDLAAGDQIGYGGDWIASKPTTVGIVSIGYGDGYSRQLSNNSSVLINDNIVSVLGRVSMDMIAIDISNISGVEINTEVILWDGDKLSVESVAKQAKTIPYELLCQISERVKRNYHSG